MLNSPGGDRVQRHKSEDDRQDRKQRRNRRIGYADCRRDVGGHFLLGVVDRHDADIRKRNQRQREFDTGWHDPEVEGDGGGHLELLPVRIHVETGGPVRDVILLAVGRLPAEADIDRGIRWHWHEAFHGELDIAAARLPVLVLQAFARRLHDACAPGGERFLDGVAAQTLGLVWPGDGRANARALTRRRPGGLGRNVCRPRECDPGGDEDCRQRNGVTAHGCPSRSMRIVTTSGEKSRGIRVFDRPAGASIGHRR